MHPIHREARIHHDLFLAAAPPVRQVLSRHTGTPPPPEQAPTVPDARAEFTERPLLAARQKYCLLVI